MRVTKVASTPANPAIGLVRGVRAILERGRRRARRRRRPRPRHHGRHQCAAARPDQRARADRHRRLPAYPRDRPPVGAGGLRQFLFLGEAGAHRAAAFRARGRRPARFPRRRSCGRSTRRACARPRSFSAHQGVRAIGVCLIHSYANPAHERRVAEIFAAGISRLHACRCPAMVLPEYREYERAVTTLVDAFVKPHMERYLRRVHDELGAGLEDKPFLVMQSSGGVASAEQVVQQADHHRAVGPGGRRARQRRGGRDRRLPRRGDARRRRHLDRSLPDRRRPPARHQWRRSRRVPGAHPDDRHRDHRHRRRLDRLDQPRRPSQGRAAQRRRRARTYVLSERRRRADHHRRQSGARAHPRLP